MTTNDGLAPLRRASADLLLAWARYAAPHYSRGRDWGRMIGEWINFYTLRSLKLIRHAFRKGHMAWRSRTFTLPQGTVLDYPIIPHTPYTQHGLPSEEAYVGRLSFPIGQAEKEVVIA